MTPERWKRISEIFARAVILEPDQRRGFLDRECAGAPEERQEVDQLLAAASTPAASRLERSPADSASAAWTSNAGREASWVGRRVGIYDVVAELGHGGMGIVYLANDTRLNRKVAIKALPPSLAADPQRRARLRTEAVAAAGLAHPGIAAVYALEEIGDDLFIVSEFVDGRSLRQALSGGPMRLPHLVELAAAVADALAFAHTRGVVHRDLKPDNVLLPTCGGVKVVDFGLARMLDSGGSSAVTAAHLTRSGMLLGTPAYMAPEQVRGGPVDVRTDVFALGVMIYECATGANPFASRTPESSMARVLEQEVDIGQLHVRGMRVLGPIVRRAVAKDPAARYPSAGELAAALEAIRGVVGMSGPQSTPVSTPALPSMVTTSWRVHQVVVSTLALVMLWPLSAARPLGPWMTQVFFLALAASVLVIALRTNQLFLSFVDVGMLREQRTRWGRLLLAADLALCGALALAAALCAGTHLGFASLFAATALGLAAAALIIEPTTTKTAFPE
jgi:serine/threonine-protein kinase